MRFALVMLLALPACDLRPDLASYDRTCSVDDDCVPVGRKDDCNDCDCPDDAVNASEAERFRQEQELSCAFGPDIACDCIFVEAICNNATCAIQPGE